MQPKTGQTQGQTASAVQSDTGACLAPNQVKSIQLPDGWHDVENIALGYTDAGKTGARVQFSEILSFSDSPRER